MFSLIGLAVTFAMVFGGFTLAGGKLSVVLEALPFEMMMIGGAAVGGLLVSNSMAVLKKVLKSFGRIMAGPRWKRADYRDLLTLLFVLTKRMKTKGMMAIEPHIDRPDESDIFGAHPRIQADHFAISLICDSLRMMSMNMDDPHQVETMIERQLDKHHHETLQPAAALQSTADALPALGIVAAVLGVIKTMSSIDQPVEVLGQMIGGALVGTFLGVFLAYGMVGPMAARLRQIAEEEAQFHYIIRDVLTAYLHGHPPQLAVETGRGHVPSNIQPSFHALDEAISALPA
jgi:chemotaxis protein MotA